MRVQNLILAAALAGLAGADRAQADNVYYVGTNNGASHTFGTVNSAGQTTTIATNLSFGGDGAVKLMFAPNGDLYAFGVDYGGGSGAWGRVNPATGAFTQIGNLNTSFNPALDHNENYGFSLAFGPSGTLYATGWDGNSSDNMEYGTLSLTTGAFTEIAASPVGYEGSLVTAVPEPSAIVLLGVGVVSLLAYGWRRKPGDAEYRNHDPRHVRLATNKNQYR
jgi:hypothetical protein